MRESPTFPVTSVALRFLFWLGLCWTLGSSFPMASSAQDRVFSIKDSATLPGAQLQIELCLSELQDFAGGDFRISFDPAVISIVNVNKAAATSNFILTYGVPSTGRVSISMAAAEGLVVSGEGTIAILKLQLSGNAVTGTVSVLSVRTARWYDEMSVRHTFLGDNGLLAVDTIPPGNDPLTLALGNDEGEAGGVVNLPLTLSMGHSAGKVSGDITFNPALFSFVDLQFSSLFAGWTSQVQVGTGTLHFNLSSAMECSDPQAVEMGTVAFSISGEAESGTTIPVELTGTTISNLEGLAYSHLVSGGTIQVTTPVEPTSTPSPSPSATTTPTPTATTDELHPADFNGDRTVDQADLLLFLKTWHLEVTRP